MAIVCPTVTATNMVEYSRQIDNIKEFASQIHIDLMDGKLAPSKSPDIDQIYWPGNVLADIHLMYMNPKKVLKKIIDLKPNMVIIHPQVRANISQFTNDLRLAGIKTGLAVLQSISIDSLKDIISYFDQILIFSGHLGYQGGQTDLTLLEKVPQIKNLSNSIEIAWDGGINDQNASVLVDSGIDVLNVGGFIQDSDNPHLAYDKIIESLENIDDAKITN
jgi:ribulose-phosphate 3-epimerase